MDYLQRQEAEVAAYIAARVKQWRNNHPHWPAGEGIPHVPLDVAQRIAEDAAVYRHGWRQGHNAAVTPIVVQKVL